jgi:hypothetical protein
MARELTADEVRGLSPDEQRARRLQRAMITPWNGAIVPENLFVSLGSREGGYFVHKLAPDGVTRLSAPELERAMNDHPALAAMLALANPRKGT